MAHWAQIDDNGVVLRVTVGDNDAPDEGYSWLVDNLGGTWVQTSYTSYGGNRLNPETGEVVTIGDHFRYSYAGTGYRFDPNFGPDGAFIPPQPFPSWVLNPDTALWDAPTPMPEDGGIYAWDEENQNWMAIS